MLNMLFILLNLQFQYIAASTRTDFYHAEATQSIIQYNYSLNYSLDEIFSIKNINSVKMQKHELIGFVSCLLYTSPSPRDLSTSRMPSSA